MSWDLSTATSCLNGRALLNYVTVPANWDTVLSFETNYGSTLSWAGLRGDKPLLVVTDSEEGSDGVIGVYVTFQYSGEFDSDRVMNVADKARSMFEGMPGLRFKFFTLDETQQRARNFYVWESREAAEAFFTDELRERVTDLYGVAPGIDFVDIAQIVDNSGT